MAVFRHIEHVDPGLLRPLVCAVDLPHVPEDAVDQKPDGGDEKASHERRDHLDDRVTGNKGQGREDPENTVTTTITVTLKTV